MFTKIFYLSLFLPFSLSLSSEEKQESAKGIHYEHRITEDPLSIHILDVDPDHILVKAVAAHNKHPALEKTSSLAQKHKAVAAVNGGFFRATGPYAGFPSGVLKIDGVLLSSPRFNRAAIGWSKGGKEVLIDRLGFNGDVEIKNIHYPIDVFNQPRSAENCALYSSHFLTSTLTEEDGGREMAIDDQSHLLSSVSKGNSPIPSDGWVYSIGPGRLLKVPRRAKGEIVSLHFSLFPILEPKQQEGWDQTEYIIGGTPVLITKGHKITNFSSERLPNHFVTSKHPRTAIGLKPNGHWIFVVVDGRQPEFSIGMTIDELSDFMYSLGCTYALNLDGGGSSTFYYGGQVLNSPSGDEDVVDSKYIEREVSDAILLFPREN